MEKKQLGTIAFNPQVKLTFSHKVTRDQLIANLDRILGLVGCPACGLNGLDAIVFRGDPYAQFADIRHDILRGKVEDVLNFEIGNNLQSTF